MARLPSCPRRRRAITRFTDCMDKICKMTKRVCKAKITAGIGHVCSISKNCRCPISARRMPCPTVCSTAIPDIIAEIDPQENADSPEEPFIQKIIKGQGGERNSRFWMRLRNLRRSLRAARCHCSGTDSHYGVDHGAARVSGRTTRSTWRMCSAATGMCIHAPCSWSRRMHSGNGCGENCLEITKQVQNERQDTTKSFEVEGNRLCERALRWIPTSGIETICGYLNVSAYFSTVFKETGKTFINHLDRLPDGGGGEPFDTEREDLRDCRRKSEVYRSELFQLCIQSSSACRRPSIRAS